MAIGSTFLDKLRASDNVAREPIRVGGTRQSITSSNKLSAGVRNRLRKIRTTLEDPSLEAEKRTSLQNRFNVIRRGVGLRRRVIDPVTGTATSSISLEPTPEPTPSPTPTVEPTVQDDSTFLGSRDFIPTQYENSPLYQAQKEEGLKEIQRLLAARGLSNSGAQIEAETKFLNDLLAGEADKARAEAQLDAQRYDTAQRDAADRMDAEKQTTFDNFYRTLDLLLRQNPISYGASAAGDSAQLTDKYGQRVGNFRRGNFRRQIARRSSGPGTFLPPFPSSPNFSAADLYGDLGRGQQTGSVISGIGSLLGALQGAGVF